VPLKYSPIACAALCALWTSPLWAARERVLHSFNAADGLQPFAGLIFDNHGNLYGTAEYGGANNYGRFLSYRLPATDHGRKRCCIPLI
jgi:hypothetical protein